MVDRRTVLRGGSAVAVGALAIAAAESGSDPAYASVMPALLGNPAETGGSLGYPKNLTREERRNLETFDQLDFVVFSGQQWDRVRESHSDNIRAHWPDGHYTDSLAAHIEDTVGIWNKRGVMDEEFIIYDQLTFMRQLGLA